MVPDQTLQDLFGKFAGRSVAASEKTHTLHLKNLGMKESFTLVHLRRNGRTLRQLTEAARAAGYSLRVWTPGCAGTCDFIDTRLNVSVEKDAEGKYRLGRDFRLG